MNGWTISGCSEHLNGCPVPSAGRAFYVSVRNGSRTGILAGPYASHAAALAALPETQRRANKADPFAAFYAFGTCQGPNTLRTIFGIL